MACSLATHHAKVALHCGHTGAIGSSEAYAIDVSLKEAILAGFVEGPRHLAGSHELVTTGEMSDYASNRNFFMELGNTGLMVTANGPQEWRLAARREAGRGCDVIEISASPSHGAQPARNIRYRGPTSWSWMEIPAWTSAAWRIRRTSPPSCSTVVGSRIPSSTPKGFPPRSSLAP